MKTKAPTTQDCQPGMSTLWLQCLGLSKKSAEAVMRAHNEERRDLLAAFRDCVASFQVTLMVLDERANGQDDIDKRCEFAEKHPEVIAAKRAIQKATKP